MLRFLIKLGILIIGALLIVLLIVFAVRMAGKLIKAAGDGLFSKSSQEAVVNPAAAEGPTDISQILADKFKLPEINIIPNTGGGRGMDPDAIEEPEPEPEEYVDPLNDLKGMLSDSPLELPVNGASGYASVAIPVYGGLESPEMIEQINALIERLSSEREALAGQLALFNASLQAQIQGNPEGAAVDIPPDIQELMQKIQEYDLQIKLLEGEKENMGGSGSLEPGECFRIISENGDYWEIERSDGSRGWVPYERCMINLPDVIPSIVYNITNASSSMFRTVGKPMEGITGEKLFDARDYNARLNEDEYVVPVLYVMSKKIANAQKLALENGDTLIIYEGFRPYSVQMKVGNVLQSMANSDPEVKNGVSKPPWSIRWFIARSLSNHQRGCAIDVSIGKVTETVSHEMGKHSYSRTLGYEEYKMPTAMHELSTAAVLFTTPVSSKSPTAWKNAQYAEGINNAAIRLQNYCTYTGLSPLASEWWHFNDLEGEDISAASGANGNFFMDHTMSIPAE